jgi:hypothetical protein
MRTSTIAIALALACSSVQATIDRHQQNAEAAPSSKVPSSPQSGRQPVEVEMQNVDLHVTPEVTLRIRHLRGRFTPAGRADMPYLDDKLSYVVVIDSGEIALDMSSLNALMTNTLGHGRSNVEKLRVSTDEKRGLRQKGVLKKGIKVPFDVKGAVEATPDGRIRMRAAAVRGFGVPVNPMMKLLGLEMDDLLKVEPGHGVTVDNNDLILDPEQLLPPPLVRGKVTSVRVEDGAIVQTFGSGERQRLSPRAVSQNYIYWQGGKLQFGKLTMTDTDLELVDEDPRDPFDFSVDRWNDQLVAGYSKNTPNRGLKAHMPDHNDLKRPNAGKRQAG